MTVGGWEDAATWPSMKQGASRESARDGFWTDSHLPGVCGREERGLVPTASRDGPPQPRHFGIPRPVSAERDVSRTDRTNKFYEGPENPGLGLLNDILLTYCMYHFDLGATPARGGVGGPAFPWGGGRGAEGLGRALTSCSPRLRPGHE